MTSWYKDKLCNLAINILKRYNVGYSKSLDPYTWIEVNGKYYAVETLLKLDEEGYEKVEIDAYTLPYYIKTYSKLND